MPPVVPLSSGRQCPYSRFERPDPFYNELIFMNIHQLIIDDATIGYWGCGDLDSVWLCKQIKDPNPFLVI